MMRPERGRWPASFGGLLAVLAAAGCNRPEPPTIVPRSVEVTTVTAKGLTAKTRLDVHNPNDYALKASKVRAKVVLGGKVELGPVDVDQSLKLPAHKTTELTVDVPASWASAAEIAALAAGSATIPYVVEGTVLIGGKSINVKVPFEIEGSVSRTQLAKAGFEGLPIFKLPGLSR